MVARKSAAKSGFNWKLVLGLFVLGALAWYFTSGSDAPTGTKGTAASGTTKKKSTDLFTPEDYTASFPILKTDAKDSFKPLIQKAVLLSATAKGLPNTITGGGDWSYDGTVTTNGNLQGLMDEQKTGESDFLTVGQHWKHGRVKRITDSEIVFSGDDGSTSTLKMGDSSAKASPAAGAVATTAPDAQPPALAGAIGGQMDLTPLPAVDPNQMGQMGGGRGGRGGRGRRGGFGGGGFGGGGNNGMGFGQ